MRTRTLAVLLGTAALVLGSGGGVVATTALTGKDVKNGSLSSKDLKNASLAATDFTVGTRGARGDQGGTGATGTPGAATPLGYTLVLASPISTQVAAQSSSVIDLTGCGAGKTALGGSGYWTNSLLITNSHPSANGQGWVLSLSNSTNQTIQVQPLYLWCTT